MSDPSVSTTLEEQLDLAYGLNEDGTASSQLLVTWRAHGALVTELEGQGFDPHLMFTLRRVIKISDGDQLKVTYKEARRFTVPLRTRHTSLIFPSPGPYDIVVTIFDKSGSSVWTWLTEVCKEGGGGICLVDDDGKPTWHWPDSVKRIPADLKSVSVVGPFAHTPTGWFGRYVEYWYKAWDCKGSLTQYQHKQRKLTFLLVWSWTLLPLCAVMRILWMPLLWVIGCRHLDWKFLNPLFFESDNVGLQPGSRRTTVWWHHYDDTERSTAAFLLLTFFNSITLGIALIVSCGVNLPGKQGFANTILSVEKDFAIGAAIILGIAILAAVGGSYFDRRYGTKKVYADLRCQAEQEGELTAVLSNLSRRERRRLRRKMARLPYRKD